MAKSRYTRPLPLAEAEDVARPAPSVVLYVANCGPAVGVTHGDVDEVFGTFGEVERVHVAADSGARVIVWFRDPAAAAAAMAALHGRPRGHLAGRVLHVRYSVPAAPKARAVGGALPVARSSSELGIPGIYMVEEFVTAAEEQELLAAVDNRPWRRLAKRRVQHYGYEFLYEPLWNCLVFVVMALACVVGFGLDVLLSIRTKRVYAKIHETKKSNWSAVVQRNKQGMHYVQDHVAYWHKSLQWLNTKEVPVVNCSTDLEGCRPRPTSFSFACISVS